MLNHNGMLGTLPGKRIFIGKYLNFIPIFQIVFKLLSFAIVQYSWTYSQSYSYILRDSYCPKCNKTMLHEDVILFQAADKSIIQNDEICLNMSFVMNCENDEH